jgi:hypothetical protein
MSTFPDDAALAGLCAEAYDDASSWDGAWDFDGTRLTLRRVGGAHVIVFRGTCNAEDWLHDAEAFPVWDPRVGFVHGGFMRGMSDALAVVSALETSCLYVTGHSLGGARARILAGLLAVAGRPVARCAVFGSPRPAFANLARVLQKTATPLASYRNRNDPVPLVPFMGGCISTPMPGRAWTARQAPRISTLCAITKLRTTSLHSPHERKAHEYV